MRRLTATLALALLLGCGSAVPSFDASGGLVELLTSSTDKRDLNGELVVACVLSGPTGDLVVHPQFGTALGSSPVMWPRGFTGRRVGSEVEVLDRDQHVVATTGRSYELLPAELNSGWVAGQVFVACGEVRPGVAP